MQPAFLSALFLGSALTTACALAGAMTARATRVERQFHPSRLRRWLRRLLAAFALVLIGAALAVLIALVAEMPTFAALSPSWRGTLSAAIWLIAFSAFRLGYRIVDAQRFTRALDAGIAVGLH